jgi:acyl-coenzyme A thioesterase PaaI-like protein
MQESASSPRPEAPEGSRRWCFGCGEENPAGLRIAFRIEGTKAIGEFTPRQVHLGFPGFAHGGVIAAAMDEAMGWALYASGAWALTARMDIKYRAPVRLDERLTIVARTTRKRGRWLEGEAKMRTPLGKVLAEAKGMFVRLPPERARELDSFYLGWIAPDRS